MTNDGGEHERSEPSRRREEMSGERDRNDNMISGSKFQDS